MIKKLFFFIFAIFFPFTLVKAENSPVKAAEFKPGEMIIEHITDAHEWHILSIGNTHISIPLPIILWHEGKLHIFCYSKFHHGQSDYGGFRYMTDGAYKNKIIYVGNNSLGNENKSPTIPLDFSITKNVASLFLSVIALIIIFLTVARAYKRNEKHAPKGLQSLLEPIIIFVRDDIAKSSLGEKHYERFTPYLLTVFFFIFFNNLFGIVPFFPGGANVTGNITVTMMLALFTFHITNLSGNRHYWQDIFNTPGIPWWLKIPIPILPLIEFLGLFTKPFVLMVRLFANMTAGHIIVLGFMSLIFVFGNINPAFGYGISLISILMSIFISLLEILVSFLQAFVFTLLSALYFGMATEEIENSNHK